MVGKLWSFVHVACMQLSAEEGSLRLRSFTVLRESLKVVPRVFHSSSRALKHDFSHTKYVGSLCRILDLTWSIDSLHYMCRTVESGPSAELASFRKLEILIQPNVEYPRLP